MCPCLFDSPIDFGWHRSPQGNPRFPQISSMIPSSSHESRVSHLILDNFFTFSNFHWVTLSFPQVLYSRSHFGCCDLDFWVSFCKHLCNLRAFILICTKYLAWHLVTFPKIFVCHIFQDLSSEGWYPISHSHGSFSTLHHTCMFSTKLMFFTNLWSNKPLQL